LRSPARCRRFTPMYQLLATDIDDTLLAPDGSLPEVNVLALNRLRKAGVIVVLSSGRATISMRAVAAKLFPPEDPGYLISFNGAQVISLAEPKPLVDRPVPADAVRDIVTFTRKRNILLQGYDEVAFLSERDDPRCQAYGQAVDMTHRLVPDLAEALPQGSAKLLVLDDPTEIPRLKRSLDALAGGRFETTISKPSYLEIVGTGVSKGSALAELAAICNVPLSQTVAIGDSMNDIEMIQAAGLGLAVANARQEVRHAAAIVLKRSAAEGAMEEVTERFFSS